MYRVGWFSTGRGQGSLNLLHAIVGAVRSGSVPAELAYVFCSREPGDAEGSDRYLQQVRDYGLRLCCFSSKRFKPELRASGKSDPAALEQWRLAYDRELMQAIRGLEVDLIVLAGYMLIVGPEMCRRHDMINLHPAAPDGPAGTWQEVIWQLIGQGAAVSGNMMHLVIEELDKGPAITYSTFSLRGPEFDGLWRDLEQQLNKEALQDIARREGEQNPLFMKIRSAGARREIPLVVQTVRAFADGRVRLHNRQIISGGTALSGPYCLTEEIERLIQD